MNRLSRISLAIALIVGCGEVATASLIPITNGDFESSVSLPLSNGTGTWNLGFSGTTTIPGWTISNFVGPAIGIGAGILDPSNTPYAGPLPAANGNQLAYSIGSDLSQTLTTNLAANTIYTLSVAVGDRVDFALPSYRIQLYEGSNFLAEAVNPVTPTSGFATATLVYNSTSAGGPLQIRLVNDQALFGPAPQFALQQINWDNVTLDATPASSAVPEPATFAVWGLLGSLGLVVSRFRK